MLFAHPIVVTGKQHETEKILPSSEANSNHIFLLPVIGCDTH
jgi:hypothetical protein